MEREVWVLYDKRTGKRMAMSSYLTKQQAEWDLDNMKRRDSKERMQVHNLLPHIGIIQLTEDKVDIKPGDIVDGREGSD
jgi:hypothetical protein